MATTADILKGFVDTYAGLNQGQIKGKMYVREKLREDMLAAQKARELNNLSEYRRVVAEANAIKEANDQLNAQNTENWRASSLKETIRHNQAMEGIAQNRYSGSIYDASLDGFVDPKTMNFTPLKNAPNKPADDYKDYNNVLDIVTHLAYDPANKTGISTLTPEQLPQWTGYVKSQLDAGVKPLDIKRPTIRPGKSGMFVKDVPAETSFITQQPAAKLPDGSGFSVETVLSPEESEFAAEIQKLKNPDWDGLKRDYPNIDFDAIRQKLGR